MKPFSSVDYPWGPVRDALETTVVRVAVFLLVMLFAMAMGFALADKSFAGFVTGLMTAHWTLINGLFFSMGIVVFPGALIFAILFVRYEWVYWTVIIPFSAMLYVSYDATDYVLNRSTAAKLQKQLNETMENAVKEMNVKEN